MAAQKKVLIVMTSVGHIEAANKPTGWFLPELAHPYEVFVSKNLSMTFASPKGGVSPVDPASIEMFKSDPSSQKFLTEQKSLYENTRILSTIESASEYDALFFPGGVGPMFDLVSDPDSQRLIREFISQGKPVSAVCHGPIVFTEVKYPDAQTGEYILKGKQATGFSNEEEEIVGAKGYLPFLLEDKIKAAGGSYTKAGEAWGECVVVQDGGKFITGQNPASSKGVGEELVKAMGL